MSKHFDGDLLDGKAGEDAFARILLAGREKWEHKRDKKCSRTGNIAFEYETSELPNGDGRRWPSGLGVCEAHWFVIEFAADRRLILPTADVKELVNAAVRAKLNKWIGDDNRFHNALVPITWILALADPTPQSASPVELERVVQGWQHILPTRRQADEYGRTGSFTPDAEGWAA